ncbi:MAG: PP2C family protein-serine/threonine phosphatase [Bacteroidales bacterium]
MKRARVNTYLFTFLGVGLTIFIVGFIGITVSLRFIERNYVNIQVEVNERHAKSMAKLLENEIKMGIPPDTVRARFQKSIEGTEHEKGFLCMFNTNDASLACHPDPNLIGMEMPQEFSFKLSSQKQVSVPIEISKGKPISGLYQKGDMGTDIVHMEPVRGTPWLMAAHTNYDLIRSEFAIIKRNYILGSAMLGILIALAASVTARRIGRIYESRIEKKNQQLTKSYAHLEELHKEVQNQKEEIEAQNNLLVSQKDIITKQKDDIIDSIEYAKRIQDALLNAEETLNKHVPNHFLIFKPKDIVSGDFYWCRQKDDKIFIAAADCTGHGVPGAFMSVLGITLLNEIVDTTNCEKPSDILNELRFRLKKALNQSDWDVDNSDGIEMSLIQYSPSERIAYLAASYQTILVHSSSNYIEVKGDRCPIGVCFGREKKFHTHTIELDEPKTFYMYSDGYPDQIGGEHNKKFYTRKLKELIADNSKKELDEQKMILEHTLKNHMGDRMQVDDIILMGICLG